MAAIWLGSSDAMRGRCGRKGKEGEFSLPTHEVKMMGVRV